MRDSPGRADEDGLSGGNSKPESDDLEAGYSCVIGNLQTRRRRDERAAVLLPRNLSLRFRSLYPRSD